MEDEGDEVGAESRLDYNCCFGTIRYVGIARKYDIALGVGFELSVCVGQFGGRRSGGDGRGGEGGFIGFVGAEDGVLWKGELDCPYYNEQGEGGEENVPRFAFSLVEGEGGHG